MLHETPGPLEPAALLLPAELLALWLPLLIVALVLAVKLNGKPQDGKRVAAVANKVLLAN